jgi:hypothetical protein
VFHIVEVGSFSDDPVATMSNIRTWFDHYGSRPVIFSQATDDGTVLRLEFRSEGEAARFVGTFGGRLIRPECEVSAALGASLQR